MPRPGRPRVLSPWGAPEFPDANQADARGLLAVGGALSPAWLLSAYERGIFPWYDEGLPPLWWSPDPRAVLDAEHLHVSRSLRRFIGHLPQRVTFNQSFERVMLACGETREEGTWILPDMLSAYSELHRLGHAHSFEVWNGERLVGGLYGVQLGAFFAAESMFHLETNASKVALVCAVKSLFGAGVRLFDVQFLTPHLASMGAFTLPRQEYLRRLAAAIAQPLEVQGLTPILN